MKGKPMPTWLLVVIVSAIAILVYVVLIRGH